VLCSDESTFVTDDVAQCLCCVFLANWCAYGASLDVGTLGQPTQQGFSEVLMHFLSRRGERRASLRRYRWFSEIFFTCGVISFLHPFLRAQARSSARCGVCGVEVFSRLLFRQKIIVPTGISKYHEFETFRPKNTKRIRSSDIRGLSISGFG
jgi:hypothetical protein